MITEKFSPTEMKALKHRLSQYGAIKHCADTTGVHRTTIARLLRLGEATDPVAGRIRAYLNLEETVGS